MERNKLIGFVLVFVVLASAIAVAWFFAPPKYTILSVSQIQIEPTGTEQAGEYKGGYWVILMTADMNDAVGAYKFDKNQAAMSGNSTLIPQATLDIQIRPLQPYYYRSVKSRLHTVYPKTYGTWMGWFQQVGKMSTYIPAFDVSISEWDQQYYEKYTPFEVVILKNGVEIAKTTMNTEGGQRIVNVQTGEGAVTITSLGTLGGSYGEPQLGDIAILDDKGAYTLTSAALKYVDYDKDDKAFSKYWFGGGTWNLMKYNAPTGAVYAAPVRWSDDNSPAGYAYFGGLYGNLLVEQSVEQFPGWYRASDGARPLIADLWKDNPDPNGNYQPKGLSLWNYLLTGVGDASIQQKDLDVWKAGYGIENNKLRINLPFHALGSGTPMFTIRIPTELADTIVWKPPVANVKVSSFQWTVGGTSVTIENKATAQLKVVQRSTVESTAEITASIEGATYADVNPKLTSVTLKPNEEKTLTFEVSNLGPETSQSGKLKIVIRETFAGTTTDQSSIDFTLKPKAEIPPEPPTEPPEGEKTWLDYLKEYSWLILIVIIVIAAVIGLLVARKKRWI